MLLDVRPHGKGIKIITEYETVFIKAELEYEPGHKEPTGVCLKLKGSLKKEGGKA
jgi:hypothetical protein